MDYERINKMLDKTFAWSVARTFSREEVEELTQEILFQALKSIVELRDDNKFEPWFWRLASITLKVFKRGKAKNRSIMSFDEVTTLASEDDYNFEADEEYQNLRRSIAQMSAAYRDIIVMQECTNSIVTGVDLSSVAIESAINRTKMKSSRLKFLTGDMMNLPYSLNSFDSIILIDTHYFIDDFDELIDKLIELVVPNGHICIFSDEGRGIQGCDDSNLQANESLIGQLLERKALSYTALNLSKENREHWKVKEKVLYELKSDFESEDNMFLYNNRISECISLNRELDCRFLFNITKE